MSITADGRHAVSTSEDYTATVWNLEDRSSTATFMGESSLSSCALSPVSNDIAIGDASGRVHLLRLET